MTSVTADHAARPTGAGLPLILRFAGRELRGGLRGFRVFIACIGLGVFAIAGIGALAASFTDGLARESRVILGGDLAFTLVHRETAPAEQAFLDRHGTVSVAATMRAMARTPDGRVALVETKAVDDSYPLFGAVKLDPVMPLAAAIETRDGVYGAAADPALLTRLDLNVGDRVTVGKATIEIRATLQSEPDKLAGGIGFGPRLLISEAALRASGLLLPGSLVYWHYRLRLPPAASSDAATEAVVNAANAELPDAGWRITTRAKAAPRLERDIARFSQYLTLVGLTALLVGGVGVANAVRAHLDRRRDVIATMKALGATGFRVVSIYLAQVMALALIGAVPGVILGAALPFIAASVLGPLIPLPLEPTLHVGQLGVALLYGLLTAVAFALWPLGRAHDVPVSALFRDQVAGDRRRWPRAAYVIAAAAVVSTLAAFAILLAHDRNIALMFVGAAVAVFVALRLVAALVMEGARRLPHPRSTALRLAIANIHRPGALTTSVVLSLGLGLALLVSVIEIDGNLRRQLLAAMPERAPAFFFVDIQSNEVPRFEKFVHAHAPAATLDRVPMLRGRIVAVNGVPSDKVDAAADARWVLQSDRGITYSATLPKRSHLVAGKWWAPDYSGPPLLSLDHRIANGLGLKLGDTLRVNVLGRTITATLANIRDIDWESLGINFVMVFSPSTFAGAPHAHVATLTYPGGSTAQEEATLLKAVADAFPTITAVRVRDALQAVADLVASLIVAIRGASLVTVIAAILVLGGALAAGHRHRVYDAVVLRTLGATRRRLVTAYAFEYLLLGLATAVFGVAAGSATAALVVGLVMNVDFVWLPSGAIVAALAAVAVTVGLGLVGTVSALGQKPAPVLRNL